MRIKPSCPCGGMMTVIDVRSETIRQRKCWKCGTHYRIFINLERVGRYVVEYTEVTPSYNRTGYDPIHVRNSG